MIVVHGETLWSPASQPMDDDDDDDEMISNIMRGSLNFHYLSDAIPLLPR